MQRTQAPPWQCGKAALNVLNEQTAVTNCRTQNCNQLILRRWTPNGNAVLIITALLRRRVNRARNRNMHRRSYRHLKTQALALARQVPLFKAQDPTDNLEFLDWFKPKPFDSHTHTITHEEFSLGFSDYQDNSFKDHGITDYKIASLNCRGLASPSSRERLVHTM